MTRIVVIEDDHMITQPLARALRGADYEVDVAHDGTAGLALVQQTAPDLVVLDIMLPGMDGWEVCKAIRASSVVPILMLTALNDEVDRVLGLELGADDYITKPFSTRELIARIKALLRRVAFDTANVTQRERLVVGPLEIHLDTRRVFKNGVELSLRFKEFELLSLLAARAGQVVSRAEIFDRVWGTDWLGDMRTLDVHIRWLREKLEADPSHPRLIQTVRGVGYQFHPSSQEEAV